MLADGWKDKENDKESNKKEAMADVSEGNKESSKEDVQILSGGRVSVSYTHLTLPTIYSV